MNLLVILLASVLAFPGSNLPEDTLGSFTREELLAAVRLVAPDSAAAEFVAKAFTVDRAEPGPPVFTEEFLMLLSLVSEATEAKVEQYLRDHHWTGEQIDEWRQQRDELRRSLEQGG